MRFFYFFPFLFCCFFPYQIFAASCGSPSGNFPGWGETVIEMYDCVEERNIAYDDCSLGKYAYVTVSATDGYHEYLGIAVGTLLKIRASHPQTLHIYGLCVDDCCSASESALSECLDEQNISWGSSCSYSCKCPGYTGQPDYDFENCDVLCDLQQATDDAVSECGDIESVKWDNISTCKWHCDQGDCEDEYQAAKQNCPNPYLIDRLTCEYTCSCPNERAQAEETCTAGYYLDPATCEWSCKCCLDKYSDCEQYCGGDNVKPGQCSQFTPPGGECIVDLEVYTPCECIVPPVDDPDPDPPEDDPQNCTQFKESCRASGCEPTCISDPETGEILLKNCDCGEDPTDPGPDGEEGTPDDEEKDDGANGWLKAIEENTDRTASLVKESIGRSNEWLEAIKHNTDTVIENDKKFFLDGAGKPYLKIIAEKLDELKDADELDITTTGSGTLPENNEYSTTFSQAEGFEPLPEDTFSQDLSDYIATGIPLVSYLKGTEFNLSSSSSVLSFNVLGKSVSVDFAQYSDPINYAGDILFYLTILSSFMMIIGRSK